MWSKLPRELRDAIYVYYWNDPLLQGFAETLKCRARGLEGLCLCAPHLLLANVVGNDIVGEAAVAFCKQNMDQIYTDPVDLEKDLRWDGLKLGLTPRDYFSCIILNINDQLYTKSGVSFSLHSPAGMVMLENCLKALLLLGWGNCRTLQIRFPDCNYEHQSKDMLKLFQPYRDALAALGAIVKVNSSSTIS